MNNQIIKFHFVIRILGIIGVLSLTGLSDYRENTLYLMLVVLIFVVFAFMAVKRVGVFKKDIAHFHGLYFDILILSIAIAFRGGLRSDYYLGYYLVLGYAMNVKSSKYLPYLSGWIGVSYSFVCLMFTAEGTFSLGRLLIRLVLMIGTMFLLRYHALTLSRVEEQREKALHLSLEDKLTGAYNRRILDNLDEFMICKTCIAYVVILDIDDFKYINDTYGHVKGDDVLKVLALIIKGNIEAIDLFVRYGGEEFLLVFQSKDQDEIVAIMHRIQEELKNVTYPWLQEQRDITFTAGLSVKTSDESLRIAIERADENLYIGKNRGKDCIIIDDQLAV